jgi:hypothetical protein
VLQGWLVYVNSLSNWFTFQYIENNIPAPTLPASFSWYAHLTAMNRELEDHQPHYILFEMLGGGPLGLKYEMCANKRKIWNTDL